MIEFDQVRNRGYEGDFIAGQLQPARKGKGGRGKLSGVIERAREAYHTLYLNIVNHLPGSVDDPFTLGVTAVNSGEGSSNVAVNLAVTIAGNTARNVLLVDGNLYAPILQHYLSVPDEAGLSEVLRGEIQFDAALTTTRYDRLWLLQAGFTTPELTDESVLNLPIVDNLLHQLKTCFDTVILDLPPVREGTAASLLAKKLDGTVLVIRSNATKRGDVQEAIERLGKASLVGVAVNFVRNHLPIVLSNRIK